MSLELKACCGDISANPYTPTCLPTQLLLCVEVPFAQHAAVLLLALPAEVAHDCAGSLGTLDIVEHLGALLRAATATQKESNENTQHKATQLSVHHDVQHELSKRSNSNTDCSAQTQQYTRTYCKRLYHQQVGAAHC